jgi:hypothetical protein
VIAGPGGWFLAVLTVASVWPSLFGSPALVVVAIGIAIGLCVQFAWIRRDWTPQVRYGGLAAALAGSVSGAWLGYQAGLGAFTALVGATITANLALLILDIIRDRRLGARAVPAAERHAETRVTS